MTALVVIPSWGRTTVEIEAETGARFPAFIFLAGRPLYAHILERAQRSLGADCRSRIVLPLDAPALEHLAEPSAPGTAADLRLPSSGSIGETVLAALDDLEGVDQLVVNMADTLVEFAPEGVADLVYVQERHDLYKWTSVELASGGELRFPSDRTDSAPVALPREICVGVFAFSRPEEFRAALKAAVASPESSKDPFFSALEAYSSLVAVSLRRAEAWLDFGHIDSYYGSKLAHQNLRHFNSLEYDRARGLVTKRSERVEAYRHQVRWFKQLPDDLAAFVPRIHHIDDGEAPHITMEMLSIPTLSELFLSQRIQVGVWNGVARAVKEILARFDAYSVRSSLGPAIAEAVYLEKTLERLNAFVERCPAALAWWVDAGAGQRFGVREALAALPAFVRRFGLLDCERLTPIHGDFCFSNLLFDLKASTAKMIDPRGEFGVPGIFGDSRYDLAKLSHSYSGGYDYIVTDRFDCEVHADGQLQLRLPRNDYRAQVEAIFQTWLLRDRAIARQIRAIEALLFLSMVPLHSDAPHRQQAMLATGLTIFSALHLDPSQ